MTAVSEMEWTYTGLGSGNIEGGDVPIIWRGAPLEFADLATGTRLKDIDHIRVSVYEAVRMWPGNDGVRAFRSVEIVEGRTPKEAVAQLLGLSAAVSQDIGEPAGGFHWSPTCSITKDYGKSLMRIDNDGVPVVYVCGTGYPSASVRDRDGVWLRAVEHVVVVERDGEVKIAHEWGGEVYEKHEVIIEGVSWDGDEVAIAVRETLALDKTAYRATIEAERVESRKRADKLRADWAEFKAIQRKPLTRDEFVSRCEAEGIEPLPDDELHNWEGWEISIYQHGLDVAKKEILAADRLYKINQSKGKVQRAETTLTARAITNTGSSLHEDPTKKGKYGGVAVEFSEVKTVKIDDDTQALLGGWAIDIGRYGTSFTATRTFPTEEIEAAMSDLAEDRIIELLRADAIETETMRHMLPAAGPIVRQYIADKLKELNNG